MGLKGLGSPLQSYGKGAANRGIIREELKLRHKGKKFPEEKKYIAQKKNG